MFYDYWLENSTLALAWLRREGVIRRAVARAHRFDLYDECWSTGTVPFRALKVAALDRVFAISEHGRRYLAARAPLATGKILLSRLGVSCERPRVAPSVPAEGPLIVSCANLHPFKRVDRIPSLLAELGGPVRWVHFGDGPCRAEVERLARMLPSRVSWRLAGHVDHADVLAFYREHRVDLFVSLSESEGLPVSMMEAIGSGIPVLATSVGGVPEIVTEDTGILVGWSDSAPRIAEAARRLLSGEAPERGRIRRFFEEHFDAETNFSRFADMLHAV
jgi:glycosyltransferase involved in cell wall biosynthesis